MFVPLLIIALVLLVLGLATAAKWLLIFALIALVLSFVTSGRY